jgi:hypothetical protein
MRLRKADRPMIRKGREIESAALFSPSNVHRYTLTRDWSADFLTAKTTVLWIMLNPSTASATKDDATIRRCMDYAMAWGFGRMIVCNLFTYRATQPQMMISHKEPNGQDADQHILREAHAADLIVCGWGKHGKCHGGRDEQVLRLLRGAQLKLTCLHRNDDGTPTHPLFLPLGAKPIPFD